MKLVISPAIDAERLARIVDAAGPMTVVNAADTTTALREIVDADAFFGKLTPELLRAAKKLRWVQSPTASLEHYLFPELVEHPCVLSNMRGLFSDVIADHVMGLVLCFARNLQVYLRQQRWAPVGDQNAVTDFVSAPGTSTPVDAASASGRPHARGGRRGGDRRRNSEKGVMLRDVIMRRRSAATFGRWRAGRGLAGRAIAPTAGAERLRCDRGAAYARNVQAVPPAGVSADAAELGPGEYRPGSDCRPRRPDRGVAGRGDCGHGIDVCEVEPLPAEHPLWQMPNVIITPHVAAASPRIAERHLETLLENIRRFVRGEPPATVVDKRKWY